MRIVISYTRSTGPIIFYKISYIIKYMSSRRKIIYIISYIIKLSLIEKSIRRNIVYATEKGEKGSLHPHPSVVWLSLSKFTYCFDFHSQNSLTPFHMLKVVLKAVPHRIQDPFCSDFKFLFFKTKNMFNKQIMFFILYP